MRRKVVQVYVGSPLSQACKIMGIHKIRHLIVTDAGHKPVGLLSERDIFKFCALRMANAQSVYGKTAVGEVMVKSPITISASRPITEAAAILAREKIGCLIVVEQEMVGLITRGDVLRWLATTVGN